MRFKINTFYNILEANCRNLVWCKKMHLVECIFSITIQNWQAECKLNAGWENIKFEANINLSQVNNKTEYGLFKQGYIIGKNANEIRPW